MPHYNLANPKPVQGIRRIAQKKAATGISDIRVVTPSPAAAPVSSATSASTRASAPAPNARPKAKWSRQQLAVFKQIGVTVADVEKYNPTSADGDDDESRR
jgi:hypothetical protein